MHFRFDQNILLLWLFLILQIVVVICYLSFSSSWRDGRYSGHPEALPKSVKFVSGDVKGGSSSSSNNNNAESNGKASKPSLDKYKTYYNADIDEEIHLKSESVAKYFTLVNNTVCFKFGTDIGYMQRNMGILKENGKCECLPGYHGNDCSLPEVIWRAFIASRQETVLHKRVGKARRIIHQFSIVHPAQIQQAIIKINELFDTVDLFVVSESNKTDFGESKPLYFKEKLDKGLLKSKQYKILYVPLRLGRGDLTTQFRSESEMTWDRSRPIIRNMRDDDLFIQFNNSEVPNSKALLFFKLYDGFSLPIRFRLKWNVYGYYFQHPNRTRTVSTGSTIRALVDVYRNDPNAIRDVPGLTVGDLNHYGGWFCELCHDPNDILNVIQTFSEYEEVLSSSTNLVDIKYLEDLIGDGVYLDGRTQLLKTSEDRDPYYSPTYVTNNSWKYDSLMINFYNKMDYN